MLAVWNAEFDEETCQILESARDSVMRAVKSDPDLRSVPAAHVVGLVSISLQAMVRSGQRDPAQLSADAIGALRSLEQSRQSLERLRPEQRFAALQSQP